MLIKGNILAFLEIFVIFLSSTALVYASADDDWQKLIQDGSAQKFDGQYKNALQSFSKAVSLDESQKLPAESPKSSYQWELPDLYMRLATLKMDQRHIEEGNKIFYRALSLEKDKNGFHAAVVWLYWGFSLKQSSQLFAAKEKLNNALKIALALPVQKRGTVVMDAYILLAKIEEGLGNKKEFRADQESFVSEMQAQQKINSDIGPGLYHEVQKGL